MTRWLFGTKSGLLVALSAICLLLALYFAWEIVYQEPAIVRILTIAKIRDRHQKQDLEELIKDWSNNSRTAELSREERAIAKQQAELIAQLTLQNKSTGTKTVRLLSETYQRKTLEVKFGDVGTTEKHVSQFQAQKRRQISRINYHLKRPLKVEGAEDDLPSSYIEVYKYDPANILEDGTNCLMIKVTPPVPICIYPDEKDVFISSDIRSTGIWEKHIVTKFQTVLKENPDIGVLDLGANIGVYSLVAAGMGHRVVAVEPSLNNIKMFETAIHLAGLENKITILRNAISNITTLAKVVQNDQNQGDIRINESTNEVSLKTYDTLHTDRRKKENQVFTVTINNLANVLPFQQAVMKIDIQGYEHIAFSKAKNFFKKVNVPYIFMEWVVMRDFYVTEVYESDDKDLVLNMIDLLTDGNYVPYSLVSGKQLKPGSWYGWPEDVLWKKIYDS